MLIPDGSSCVDEVDRIMEERAAGKMAVSDERMAATSCR
jgi:hypothetical protein